MIRLIFSDLRAGIRIWFGIFIAAVVAAFTTAFPVAMLASSFQTQGLAQVTLSAIASTMIAFTVTTMVVVLATLANLTVGLQQRNYALWQIVGILPERITTVVLRQLAIVGVMGASLGAAIALPLAGPALDFLLGERAELVPLHLDYTLTLPWAAGMVVVLTGFVVLGGLKGARRSGRIAPIQALRTPEPETKRLGFVRWIFGALMVAWVVTGVTQIASKEPDKVSSAAQLAPLIVGLVAVVGPIVYPAVLSLWVRIVPAGRFPSWYLARHSSEFRLGQSTAAVTPLMVGIALTGGLYSAGLSLEAFAAQSGVALGGSNNIREFILIMGGPLMMSVVAAAASVFMSSKAREREFALVQATGAAPKTVGRIAILEAVIYTVTATLLGTGAIAVSQILISAALGVTFTMAPAPILMTAAGGFILLMLANVLPTVSSINKPLPRTLAVS